MSETKQTPGPWKATSIRKDEWFISSTDIDIARILHNGTPHPKGKRGMHNTMAANAKLIAASPDLLAALQLAVVYLRHPDVQAMNFAVPVSNILKIAIEAITKTE